MTTENLEVPNLEARQQDGKPTYTPKQWVERFKQFTKRKHKVDITPLLKGEAMTDSTWAGIEKKCTRRLHFGPRP